MVTPIIAVLWDLADGVQVGYRCVCGPCQPTASIFRDDPQYERHDWGGTFPVIVADLGERAGAA